MSAALAARARRAFHDAFGTDEPRLFIAPGRVNLIGEHTDYNDGFVLPAAIDLATIVAARPIAAPRIEIAAADLGAHDLIELAAPIRRHAESWRNYGRGIVATMQAAGHRLRGAQLAVVGDIPLGSGLSSSASLEMAVATALSALSDLAVPPRALALIAQQAENQFAGCACGIMDQLIAAEGIAGHAMLIDCRALTLAPIAIPDEIAIVIVDSGVRHAHVEGRYGERREQCEAAARHFGVAALRDLDPARLETDAAGMDNVLFRRARHVVSENARVLEAAAALQAGDLTRLGALLVRSHASMRDDFEITVPEVDRLAAIMNDELAGAGGARMTGGGFGGCVIALCARNQSATLAARIQRDYRRPDGAPPTIIDCRPAAGARELPPFPLRPTLAKPLSDTGQA